MRNTSEQLLTSIQQKLKIRHILQKWFSTLLFFLKDNTYSLFDILILRMLLHEKWSNNLIVCQKTSLNSITKKKTEKHHLES